MHWVLWCAYCQEQRVTKDDAVCLTCGRFVSPGYEQELREKGRAPMVPIRMFYCGCHKEPGHYLWSASEARLSWKDVRLVQPWGDGIDGQLCPSKGVNNGFAKFTQRYGWSAISWWDNSIDSRPGSHSTFIMEGAHSAEEVLAAARERFPWVFARFRYDVTIGSESAAFPS